MERNEIKSIVENLLLASDQPVSPDRLLQTFVNGADRAELTAVLDELTEEYQSKSLQIVQVAEGYQLCTRPEYSDWIRKFLKLDKTFRLSQAALDTLSIIAYKQPITRTEIEAIRGVDSSGVARTLLEKKIVGPAGRKDVPGKPIMYRTTQKFLEYFGLKDLTELPTLEDFSEEIQGEKVSPQAEMLFESPAEDLPGDPAQDLPGDPAEAPPQEVAQNPSGGLTEDSPGEPTQGSPGEPVQSSLGEPTQGSLGDPAQDPPSQE